MREWVEALRPVMVSVPMWQMGSFIVVITLCMLFRCYRTGLVMCYAYSFLWAFVENRTSLGGLGSFFIFLYAVCGVLILVFASWGFYREE